MGILLVLWLRPVPAEMALFFTGPNTEHVDQLLPCFCHLRATRAARYLLKYPGDEAATKRLQRSWQKTTNGSVVGGWQRPRVAHLARPPKRCFEHGVVAGRQQAERALLTLPSIGSGTSVEGAWIERYTLFEI
jgi:hypothetical protein